MDRSKLVVRALAALAVGAWLCAGAAPRAGAATDKLNAPLTEAGDVLTFAVSPNGARVVYRADDQVDGLANLFSVPIGGGAPVKLNAPLPATGDIIDFKIAPNSQRVIYRAVYNAAGQTELFSAPIGGGTPVRLSQALVAGGNVQQYAIAPDSASVAYLADAAVDGDNELFINTFAGASLRLNVALPAGGDIDGFAYSANSDYLIYRGDQEASDRTDAYSVEPDGTNRRRLSSLPATGDVTDFALAPTNQRAVFIADQEDGKSELWSGPLEGPGVEPTKLSGALGADRDVLEFDFTANGQAVLFRADAQADEKYELFRVPLAGTAPVHVSVGTSNPDSDVSPGGYAMAPDNSRLLYMADGVVEGRVELFSVTGDGSAGVFRINAATIPDGGDVTSFAINATSSRVVYRADEQTDDKFELHSNGLQGGSRVTLSPAAIDDVLDYQLSADGSAVVFRATSAATGAINLYRAPIAGGAARRLDASSVAGGNVAAVSAVLPSYGLTPSLRQVAYLADHDEDEKVELYAFDSFIRTYAPLAQRGQ